MLTSYETGVQLEFPKKPRTKVKPSTQKSDLVPLIVRAKTSSSAAGPR